MTCSTLDTFNNIFYLTLNLIEHYLCKDKRVGDLGEGLREGHIERRILEVRRRPVERVPSPFHRKSCGQKYLGAIGAFPK